LVGLEKQREKHKDLLTASCQLSDDCISAVQNLPRQDFLKSSSQFSERYTCSCYISLALNLYLVHERQLFFKPAKEKHML
jgi:hypothetical protein